MRHDVQSILKKLRVRPSKNRGQHFLINESIRNRIIDLADVKKDEVVLEIGPGPGVLTGSLAECAEEVLAIEIEPGFAKYLGNWAVDEKLDNVKVIHGDALSMDLPQFDVIVSNLPYSISTQVIFKILPLDFKRGVVMVQKEFGERLVAVPGKETMKGGKIKKRGAPTFKSNYYAEITELFKVPPPAFHPSPEVDSIVLKIIKRPFPFDLDSKEFYFKLIDILFLHRRRKIRNSLEMGFHSLPQGAGIERSLVKEIISGESLSEFVNMRPEELEIHQMVELANMLCRSLDKTNDR